MGSGITVLLILKGKISVSQLSLTVAQNGIALHLTELILSLVIGIISLLFFVPVARCPLSISAVTFVEEFLNRFTHILLFIAV